MTIQSFSGADFSVVFVLSRATPMSINADKPIRLAAEMQTITLSSTISVYPVRRLGESIAKCYTRGARTFAGSIIFTVIDKDPFQEMFAVDALASSPTNDGRWHIDMMPPMDIIISAVNESGLAGVQVIYDVIIN